MERETVIHRREGFLWRNDAIYTLTRDSGSVRVVRTVAGDPGTMELHLAQYSASFLYPDRSGALVRVSLRRGQNGENVYIKPVGFGLQEGVSMSPNASTRRAASRMIALGAPFQVPQLR